MFVNFHNLQSSDFLIVSCDIGKIQFTLTSTLTIISLTVRLAVNYDIDH